jgi:hypothetical protein
MRTKRIVYNDFAISTRTDVYCLLVVMMSVAAGRIALYTAATGDLRRPIFAGVWLFAVALSTVRVLRQLGSLEKDHPEPTNAMKLLFQVVAVQPILISVPLMMGLS